MAVSFDLSTSNTAEKHVRAAQNLCALTLSRQCFLAILMLITSQIDLHLIAFSEEIISLTVISPAELP